MIKAINLEPLTEISEDKNNYKLESELDPDFATDILLQFSNDLKSALQRQKNRDVD